MQPIDRKKRRDQQLRKKHISKSLSRPTLNSYMSQISEADKIPEDLLTPFPVVSAPSWAAIDARTGDRLWSKGADDTREVASLTKIMTALVAWELCLNFQINIYDNIVLVPIEATGISGTSANLKDGDWLSVYDLLHAVLLPSGNDAAVCLANFIGELLYEKRKKDRKQKDQKNFEANIALFVKQMNKKAKNLKMKKTIYHNPHGLLQKNKSSANDLNELCFVFRQIEQLKDIVKRRIYVKNIADKLKYTWMNTNVLLEYDGFDGLKTGTTQNAGFCLCVSHKSMHYHIILTILACKSDQHRWTESQKIVEWVQGRLYKYREYLKGSGFRGQIMPAVMAKLMNIDPMVNK